MPAKAQAQKPKPKLNLLLAVQKNVGGPRPAQVQFSSLLTIDNVLPRGSLYIAYDLRHTLPTCQLIISSPEAHIFHPPPHDTITSSDQLRSHTYILRLHETALPRVDRVPPQHYILPEAWLWGSVRQFASFFRPRVHLIETSFTSKSLDLHSLYPLALQPFRLNTEPGQSGYYRVKRANCCKALNRLLLK